MPDLLLELLSEEIPARMQRRAAEDLRKLVTDALVEAGLLYEGAKAFATPRRLALTVHGVPARSPDRREERKGPRVGAPGKAIEGFLKAAGLASIAEAKVQADKKGDFFVAVVEKPGRPAPEVIAEIVPRIVRAFPWPKSMRWGVQSAPKGTLFYGDAALGAEALSWVRPLHSILCVFGPETSETEVVDFAVDGIRAGDTTEGHRFMAPDAITVRRFGDYMPKLEKAKVVLDGDRRKDLILHAARDQALALGLELIEDEGLLEEVAGLVEWPVVLVGAFEEEFLEIPPEVIRTTIRNNQKCFVLRKRLGAPFEAPLRGAPQDEGVAGSGQGSAASNHHRPHQGVANSGQGVGAGNHHPPHPEVLARPEPGGASKDAPPSDLSNRFILVANIEATDGGRTIVAGNERVIRARLSDARHFWLTDQRDLPDLDSLREAAERFRLDLKKPLDQRMAKLAATGVVFHEKLGTQGERVERIAQLVKEIAPLVGADPEKAERAARLAKADLVSEMVGEFPELQGLMGRYYAAAQGEEPSVAAAIEDHYKPLGPSDRVPTDPVAIAVALADKLDTLVGFWAIDEKPTGSKDPYALRRAALGVIRIILAHQIPLIIQIVIQRHWEEAFGLSYDAEGANRITDLCNFLEDRLIQTVRDEGAAADLVEAVLDSQSLASQGKITSIIRRVAALREFLHTPEGQDLLAGFRRAVNILRDEERKSHERYDGPLDWDLLQKGVAEEIALANAIEGARADARSAVLVDEFGPAMQALAKLRGPVDAFFDKVLVNAPDPAVRANRLKLLNRIREATLAVADFSKVEG